MTAIIRAARPDMDGGNIFHTLIDDAKKTEPVLEAGKAALQRGDMIGILGSETIRSSQPLASGSAEDRVARHETVNLLNSMMNGMLAIDVARRTNSVRNFSVAMMMRNLMVKNMIKPGFGDIDEIILSLGYDDGPGACSPMTSRFEFLERLIADRMLTTSEYDRSIKPTSSMPSVREIGELMTNWSDISFTRICSSDRHTTVVNARFKTIFILRKVCLFSLTQIGRFIGGRDHTTALNSINQINIRMKNDSGFRLSMMEMCDIADQVGVNQSFAFMRNGAHRL